MYERTGREGTFSQVCFDLLLGDSLPKHFPLFTHSCNSLKQKQFDQDVSGRFVLGNDVLLCDSHELHLNRDKESICHQHV